MSGAASTDVDGKWQLLRVIQKMARQLELVEEEGRGEAHIFVYSGICLPAYY
jgi:hypothetical protein